ncbi:aromatic ring-hydroxylating dioxygenase subunit alpha [soil metagenome]
MYPKNCWYVAAMSHEVGRSLLPRTVLDHAMVVFRREDGSSAAISDRCSHRRVSLTLGRLVGDHVECGYHGLQFAGDGRCVHIPNQQRIPPLACIPSFKVVERDGFIWVWPGNQALADESLVPDYAEVCSSGRYAGNRANTLPVAAPCLFNIENVLDLSHVSYVHPETVGTAEVAETEPAVTIAPARVSVHRSWDDAAASPLFRQVFGWERVSRSQHIHFWPGGNVLLELTNAPAGNQDPAQVRRITVVGPCTPSTASAHYKFSAIYRDFALDDAALSDTLAAGFLKTILEDKVLLEDQQRNWASDKSDVRMVDLAVDRAPLAARKMLQRAAQAELA